MSKFSKLAYAAVNYGWRRTDQKLLSLMRQLTK